MDEEWRKEIVVSATHVQRPKEGKGYLFDHHGTVVKTEKGNSYLIHSGPDAGTVATPAKNMSKRWTETYDVPVQGDKTVQHALSGAYGKTENPLVNYVTTGTCIGAAKGAERALEKKN